VTDKHLGDRIHDLLDGRLSRDEAQLAMGHLAGCDECNTRWRELHAAREALNSSSAGIDLRFAQMLLDKNRMAEIAKGESKHAPRAAKGRDRRPATIAAASAVILGFTVVGAYLAGSPDVVTGDLVALAASGDERSIAVIDAQTMDSAEMTDWVQPDWQDSGLIPVEARIVRHADAEILIASLLVGPEPVVIVEKRGRLAAVVMERAAAITVDGVDVYVVSTAPIEVLWQSGPVVIAATCSCAADTLATAIAAFPQADEPDVMDQIGAGFGVLGAALTGH
jgi:hypothetical protein